MDIVKKPLNAVFLRQEAGENAASWATGLSAPNYNRDSYSFGAVFFLQYCDNTLLAEF